MQPDRLCQKQLYNIAIYEQETVLTDYSGGGESRYLVDPAQLIKLLDLPQPEIMLVGEPGLLQCKVGQEQEHHLFAIPKQRKGWTLMLRADRGKPAEPIRVFLPAFMLSVIIDRPSRKVIQIRAWCHGGRGTPGRDTRCYEMPLPNFTGSSHCLGNITVIALPGKVREAGLSAIFDAYFNRHADLVGGRGLPFAEYLAKYQGRFPLTTLKRIPSPFE